VSEHAVGLRNCLTDIGGLRVGHATHGGLATGVTVVWPEAPVCAAVDVRGGGPATRETELLDPANTVDAVHALCLSGGSTFGLASGDGAASWLQGRGVGFEVAGHRVPLVPAAAIFDLRTGAGSAWDGTPPYRDLAVQAIEAARDMPSPQGNVGAGIGATAGSLKGGLGTASATARSGAQVAALVVCNSFGEAVIPGTPTFWAWPLERDRELGGQVPGRPEGAVAAHDVYSIQPGRNTTLAVVATDATLDKAQLNRVAVMAQGGIARAVRPAHGPLDGDCVFALSTGARARAEDPLAELTELATLAADCVSRALSRGVYHAEGIDGWPDYKSRHGAHLAALRREAAG
jgi:L-aminopeptidase/D-esterase-like protein